MAYQEARLALVWQQPARGLPHRSTELDVSHLVNGLKMVAVLVAAILVGNWFLAEVKQARLKGKPWYQPYLSAPGILIILAFLLPIFWWLLKP